MLISSVFGLAALAQIAPLIEGGNRIAQMSTAAILGVIALSSIAALVYQFKLGQRKDHNHHEALYSLVKESAQREQESSDVIRENTKVLREVNGTLVEIKTHMRRKEA